MLTGKHIRSEVRDGVGWLTIDRRERLNSFDAETAQDFRRAGLALARDEAARVVVLAGVPGVFSSGADLKYIRAGGDAALDHLRGGAARAGRSPGAVFQQILEYLHATISEIRRSPKPWIAAVDGIAAAGGFGIAMSCDLVLASERAAFEWAYGKTGLTGAESSTFFLARLLGRRRAFELALLNPRLDARRALELGLVTAVLPADGFEAAVGEVARRVARGPARALGVTKRLLDRADGAERIDFHLDLELDELVRAADSAEFAEGLEAFFARRPPRFDKE